jgi:hypothetical protein
MNILFSNLNLLVLLVVSPRSRNTDFIHGPDEKNGSCLATFLIFDLIQLKMKDAMMTKGVIHPPLFPLMLTSPSS